MTLILCTVLYRARPISSDHQSLSGELRTFDLSPGACRGGDVGSSALSLMYVLHSYLARSFTARVLHEYCRRSRLRSGALLSFSLHQQQAVPILHVRRYSTRTVTLGTEAPQGHTVQVLYEHCTSTVQDCDPADQRRGETAHDTRAEERVT